MAIVHALIIKGKAEAVANPDIFASKVIEGFSTVDIVKSVRAGYSINGSEQHKGYNFSLLLEFEDEANLKKYLDAPELKAKKAEFLDPLVEDIIIIDFKY